VAQSIDLTVPDLGDFSDVEIIEVLVKAGDHVAPEEGLITLETDKAAMDVPATQAGEILEITVGVGDKVSSGDVIGRLKPDEQGEGSAQADGEERSDDKKAASAADAKPGAAEADEDTVEVETVDPEDAEQDTAARGGTSTLVVPDLGDFSDVDVIEVHVNAGDQVGIDDPLITLETDKAAMDVPSTAAGRIESVLLKVGDKVSKGSQIATIEAAETPGKAKPEAAKVPEEKRAAEAREREAVKKPAPDASRSRQPAREDHRPAIDEAGFAKAHASPSVRKLARELGVDLGAA
jgi:pyruvate dehydrogenase E2 component (dihydrolipoamide acetyltransferase)